MRQSTKTTMTRKLDKLCSEIVRSRGKCEWCGRNDGTLQPAHIFSRSMKSIRWDIQNNILCLCFNCHYNLAHKQPLLFAEFVKNKFGDTRYDDLKFRAKQPYKMSLEEMIDMYNHLKEKYQ